MTLCFFVVLTPITAKNKEDEFQREIGIPFSVFEFLFDTLACWIFQLLGWVSSGHVRFEETKLNVHLKEHQDISQKLWEIIFSRLVWSWKNYVILYFVFETQRVLFFLHLEKVYLLLATLRVFSDNNSFSLLMFPANCLSSYVGIICKVICLGIL